MQTPVITTTTTLEKTGDTSIDIGFSEVTISVCKFLKTFCLFPDMSNKNRAKSHQAEKPNTKTMPKANSEQEGHQAER